MPTENDLAEVVNEMYGCKTTISKKLSSQPGTYDVSVEPTKTCVINFTYFFKYSPTLKKATVWDTGQDWRMLKRPIDEKSEKDGGYDIEMAKSFKFLEN